MKTDIMEKQFLLKYFYHIDTEHIREKIQKTDSYKYIKEHQDCKPKPATFNSVYEDLFYIIFDEIVVASKTYSEYIVSLTSFAPSFFGEPVDDKETSSFRFLCGLSIFHHLIIKSLCATTKDLGIPANKNSYFGIINDVKSKKLTSLSGTTEPEIALGYINAIYPPALKTSIITKEHGTQSFSNRKRLWKQKYHEYYSYKVLGKITANKELFPDKLIFENTQANAALFLFSEATVHYYDAHLNKTAPRSVRELGNKFTELFASTNTWKTEKHLQVSDKILFDNITEATYNFSLMDYLSHIFYESDISDKSSIISLNDLFSETFNNIIDEFVLKLPITYNRSIFLKYACASCLKKDGSTKPYPRKQLNAVEYISPPNPSKDIFIREALEAMGSFFRMLNYVTLPIFENMWDVLTDSEYLGINFEADQYIAFVNRNYQVITTDYTRLPTDALTMTNESSYKEYAKQLKKILRISKNTSYSYEESLMFLSEILNNAPKTFHSSRYFDNLNHFLKRNSFLDKAPEDSFLFEHLAIPVSAIDIKKPLGKELDEYHNQRLQNIYNFVKLLGSTNTQFDH